jgi:hypothetical protein
MARHDAQGRLSGFLVPMDWSGTNHGELWRPAAADAIRRHMLCAARFFEPQPASTQPLRRAVPSRKTAETVAQYLRTDPQGIAYAIEREWIIGPFRDDPLCRLGEGATFAGTTRSGPSLQDIYGVDEYREHQPLFAAQTAATHRAEVLARQNYVRLAESIGSLVFPLCLLHWFALLPEDCSVRTHVRH